MSSLKRNKNGISVRNFLFYGDPQEFTIFLREKHHLQNIHKRQKWKDQSNKKNQKFITFLSLIDIDIENLFEF
jgi:hypothetical protein